MVTMKKIIVLLICFTLTLVCAFPALAAVPTQITFNQVSKAPALDGIVDSIYGSPVFDLRATDRKSVV